MPGEPDQDEEEEGVEVAEVEKEEEEEEEDGKAQEEEREEGNEANAGVIVIGDADLRELRVLSHESGEPMAREEEEVDSASSFHASLLSLSFSFRGVSYECLSSRSLILALSVSVSLSRPLLSPF